jgi:HTH-type transcriptional regulator, sugar sensing transcriptional regulator
MYEQSLIQAGLSKDQSIVYETLVKVGPSPASRVARKTPLSRPLVYKVLGELIDIGLVEKKDVKGKVAEFIPAHPLKLKELSEKNIEQALNAKTALAGVFDKILSDFNLMSGRPGVRFLDGIDGMQKVYDDILDTGEDFYLIRPVYGTEYEEKMLPIIKDFITQRVKRNISVISITPHDSATDRNVEHDNALLLDRTVVDLTAYDSPVEINIYGTKIAFLSYDKEFVGIIIESPQIARAMKQVFGLARGGVHVH